MRNVLLAGAVTCTATALTIYNAYAVKRQFFPTCIYLLRSGVSVLVLVAFALYTLFIAALATKTALFGPLRLIEWEHLQEYGWLAVSESFLAMTIFRDEFDARFVLIFTSVLFVKAFHWISRDRVDYMEQTARLPKYFHARMLSTIYLLLSIDVMALYTCVRDVVANGPSMAILFGNEFALLLVSLLSIVIRYTLNTTDMKRGTPWEHRSMFLFYYDFVVDALKLLIYSVFFTVVVVYYGVPLHIIRDLYLTVRSFIVRIKDIVRYRQATANMNERYPDATEEDLGRTDRVCIICREEMSTAKKLPCGHLFHFRCLRSWLERQQACPTCRRPILEATTPHRPQPPARPGPIANQRNPNDGGGADEARAWMGGAPALNPNANLNLNLNLNPNPNPNPNPNRNLNPDELPLHNEANADLVRDAGPTVVFPEMPRPPSRQGIPGLDRLPAAMMPSPFGTVPVILIPPEQIAMVQPPAHRHPAPPINANANADVDEQPVPRRPHSTSPFLADRRNTAALDSRPLYLLRSGSSTQGPILLEALGSELSVNMADAAGRMGSASQSSLQTVEEETMAMRASVRLKLRAELSTLTRLQMEVADLTERLVQAEAQLEAVETHAAAAIHTDAETDAGRAPSPLHSSHTGASSDEDGAARGKEKQRNRERYSEE